MRVSRAGAFVLLAASICAPPAASAQGVAAPEISPAQLLRQETAVESYLKAPADASALQTLDARQRRLTDALSRSQRSLTPAQYSAMKARLDKLDALLHPARAKSPAGGALSPAQAERQRMAVAQAAERGRTAAASAGRLASVLDARRQAPTMAPAASGGPAASSGPAASGVIGASAADFRPKAHLAVAGVPAVPRPQPAPSLWARAGGAFGAIWNATYAPAQKAYAGFTQKMMAQARVSDAAAGSAWKQGRYLDAARNAVASYGCKLAAGDKKTVALTAVAAAVVVAAVVAAPAIAAGGAVAGVIQAGLAGYTAYSIVKDSFALARKPSAGSAVMLAADIVPIPYLGKISSWAAGKLAAGALRTGQTVPALAAVCLALTIGAKTFKTDAQVLAHDAERGAVAASETAEHAAQAKSQFPDLRPEQADAVAQARASVRCPATGCGFQQLRDKAVIMRAQGMTAEQIRAVIEHDQALYIPLSPMVRFAKKAAPLAAAAGVDGATYALTHPSDD